MLSFSLKLILLFFISGIFVSSFHAYAENFHFTDNTIHELLGNKQLNNFFVLDNSNQLNSLLNHNMKKNNDSIDLLIKKDTLIIIDDEILPNFSTIIIEGTVKIQSTVDSLNVQNIIIAPTGKLIIGTPNEPIDKKHSVKINFIKNYDGEVGIFIFGELIIHGYDIGPTFVEVTGKAEPGNTSLTVKEKMNNWRPRDEIVITSPGSEFGTFCHVEESTISSIHGVFIELSKPLNCSHLGEFGGNTDIPKSHVSNLSRNIILQSKDLNHRGSVNFFHGSDGTINYAEFRDLGPKNVLGRYPIHFHHMGDTSRGIEVIGNSIINSENRWITIHDSNGVLVKNNVGYKSLGHGFFLEDGKEFDNIFQQNIGIISYNGNLIPSDNRASIFWIQNPQNSFRNNVAVGGAYYGFWMDIPDSWVPSPDSNELVHLRSLSTKNFENNIAYANNHAGLFIERQMISDENVNFLNYDISQFIVWGVSSRDRIPDNSGILIEGHNVIVSDSVVLNSPIGITLHGNFNQINGTEIINHNSETMSSISGVLIGGWENFIYDSKISGFVKFDNNLSYDVSLSNSVQNQVSVTINKTKLMDPTPLNFGNPVDENSSITVYDFDAPNTFDEYPKNFIIKKIIISKDIDEPSIISPKFEIIIEEIIESADPKDLVKTDNNCVNCVNIENIKKFKNNLESWNNKIITTEELWTEIQHLQKNGVIRLDFDSETSEKIIPDWFKIVSSYWIKEQISNKEFFTAMEYILNIQI